MTYELAADASPAMLEKVEVTHDTLANKWGRNNVLITHKDGVVTAKVGHGIGLE